MGRREFRQQRPKVIFCPGQGPTEQQITRVLLPSSRPTVINPDDNMNKQLCIKRTYDKTRSQPSPNQTTSPTCLHCDVTHLSLPTGFVAFRIPSWRVGLREKRRQPHKTMYRVNAGGVVCRYQNISYVITNHHKHIWDCFWGINHRFKHNQNEAHRYWRQDGGWRALFVVTHATASRWEL